MKMNKSVQILNIDILNVEKGLALKQLTKGVVFTPNVDHLVNLQKDLEFYEAYCNAEYKLLDSRVVYFFYYFTKNRIVEKISGVDLFPEYCECHANDSTKTIFLLGGLDEAVHLAAKEINNRVGRKMVVGSISGRKGFETDESACLEIVKAINASGATILAVGIGSPRQEKWINKYRGMLPAVELLFAVGGTFDILSGKKKRAPVIFQFAGLEWLYRLSKEPRRLFSRYIINDSTFVYYYLLECFHMYKNPFSD